LSHAVVGLGNPGSEYRGTRHNVGQRVLDVLARRFDEVWNRERQALVSRGRWRGEPLFLIKPLTFVNLTGPAVAACLRRHGLGAPDLILVYDDLDLPLGTVRVRMKGSAGGHKGVASVIDSLGTSDIRRVKLGIGRPDRKEDVPDHVLAPFTPEEAAVVDSAVTDAAERVLALLDRSRSAG
jgi:PTH1 family peptidyl-tRNA hydrolase